MGDEARQTTPPYTTYKSFINLINDLREGGIPTHITQSVVKGSNSGKAMMTASLKAMGLIEEDRTPTKKLKQLVDSEGDQQEILRRIVEDTYPFLFDGTVDLGNTTTEIVAKKFQDAGAGGSTISKCMAFFLAAAKDAGIKVSDRVKSPAPARNGAKKPKKSKETSAPSPDAPREPNPNVEEIPEGMERITVPLRNMEDGIIYFPAELTRDEAEKAVKAAVFILRNYYDLEDDQP